MKKLSLTSLALLIIALCGLTLYPALASAAEGVPGSTGSLTIIERTYDRGILKTKVANTFSSGWDMESNYYKLTSTVNYIVEDGKDYAHSSTTIRTTNPIINGVRQGDRSWSKTIDTTIFTRDENQLLTGNGADGYRTVISSNRDRDTGEETSTVQGGELTFAIENSQAEVKKWEFRQANWNGEKTEDQLKDNFLSANNRVNFDDDDLKPTLRGTGHDDNANLKSYSEGKTEYTYKIINGVTRSDVITSDGTTWAFGYGTIPEDIPQEFQGEVILHRFDSGRYAVSKFNSRTQNAYDGTGNLIGSPTEITRDGNTGEIKINGTVRPIKDTEATQGVERYIENMNNSYSISETRGFRFDGLKWVYFEQSAFDSYKIGANGELDNEWTAQEYHNSPVQQAAEAHSPTVHHVPVMSVPQPRSEERDEQPAYFPLYSLPVPDPEAQLHEQWVVSSYNTLQTNLGDRAPSEHEFREAISNAPGESALGDTIAGRIHEASEQAYEDAGYYDRYR